MTLHARGLGVLGLCALVLGLMATEASLARAEAAWQVSGENVNGTLLPAVQIEKLDGSRVTLLTEYLKVKIELSCTGAENIGVNLLTAGALSSSFKVKFTGCIIGSKGMESSECVPKSSLGEKGSILTTSLKGQLELSGGVGVLVVAPVEGTTLAKFTFDECPAFETVSVKGSLVLEDPKLETKALQHLGTVSPLSNLQFFASNIGSGEKTSADGGAIFALAGKHLGQGWDGLPG